MRDLEASVGRSRDGTLRVAFRLQGAISHLRLPAPGPARIGSRLWEHSCFELFIAREGDPSYHELNVSPSREWALYAFRAHREPAVPSARAEVEALEISERRSEERFEIEASLGLFSLSATYGGARLRIGLSAVLETTDGRLSYWALRHPRDRPDFHHPDAFALLLEPPPAGC